MDIKGKSLKLKIPQPQNFCLDETKMSTEDHELFFGIVFHIIEEKQASCSVVEDKNLTSGFEVWLDKKYNRSITRMILAEALIALFKRVRDKGKEVSINPSDVNGPKDPLVW